MERVSVLSEDGTPYVVVSCASLWSLVEYLSLQRVQVAYSYYGKAFRVAFPHHGREAVEQIVSDWCTYSRGSSEELHEALVGGGLEHALR